jgi:CheY-like chemotaxis protein
MTGLAVLIVEDESLVRMAAVDGLRAAGFDVFEAEDGDEALAVLARHPEIGALFTDVQMPGVVDGLALAGCSCATRPDLITVVTSGRSEPSAGELPPRARFVAKPYHIDAIARLIRAMA